MTNIEQDATENSALEEQGAPDNSALKVGNPVSGRINRVTVYGLMIDLGNDIEAFLHRSKLTDAPNQLEDTYKRGDTIDAFVMRIEQDGGRVALSFEQPPAVPWQEIRVGESYRGTVSRIESYGVFVDIGAEKPGMVHVSEMSDGYIESPDDLVSLQEEVDVRVIKINKRNRQIDLSMKSPAEDLVQAMEPEEEQPTAMAIALQRALSDDDDAEPRDTRQQKPKGGQRRNRYDETRDEIISRTLRDHSNN